MRFKNLREVVLSLAAFLLAFTPGAAQIPLNPAASRALGHARLAQTTAEPNLVEGRELNRPQSVAVDGARGFIYVADALNNRVLGWRNASSFENGVAADLVIGQRDKMTTLALGPGSGFNSGLSVPTGVAVDGQGNLFVADAGNSRIVRYSQPFAQPDEIKLADMVIGQPNFQSRGNNNGGLTERSLATLAGNGVLRIGITFDAQGNLWVTDSGNNRILRYPASALGEGASNGPAANLVLGQADFRTNGGLPQSTDVRVRQTKTGLLQPSSLAFDQGGRLFVVDALNRAVVYRPPFVNGQEAARIMGIVPPPTQGQPALAPINPSSVGVFLSGGAMVPAEGVFTIGNVPFILDTPAHRILRYDPFDQWPPEATQFSPSARATIGQDAQEQSEIRINRGLAEPNSASFFSPVAATFVNGETYIADANNNRVLVMGDISTGPNLSTGAPYAARRVLGQIGFEFRSPNFIEGREFQFQNAGIVIDKTSQPPRLYVADAANHRVLGFADARTVKQGTRADIVIGQPDFYRALINFPSNNTDARNDSGLYFPIGLAVDGEGNLWVADSGNGRVLRFPSPFSQTQTPMRADLVLGQSSFTSRVTDASARTMAVPFGIIFSNSGRLLVSDNTLNRVLVFDPPFVSGMAASRALGQADLNSALVGTDLNRFNGPRHLGVDTDDRVYVTDNGNNRVLIFAQTALAQNDARAALALTRGVNRPIAVFVSPQTGEIWVGNAGANQALRYPKFDTLAIGGDQSDYQIPAAAPLAITLDESGNLYLADATHRVAMYFPTLTAVNAANYLPRLTPGMWASLCPDTPSVCLNPANRNRAYRFTETLTVASESPLPKSLGDLQITVNEIPAPMYFTSPTQINFLLPKDLPTSGSVTLELSQPSSGRVVAAAQLAMDVASPAFFTSDATGTGLVAAVNQDGTINGPNNPVRPGDIISLYGTGYGLLPNAPPDGEPAPGVLPTALNPRVLINARDAELLYSGAAPGAAGLWQINVRVPLQSPPGANLVNMIYNSIPNNDPQNPTRIRATISVR
jgi:uncharacterized protein (TIGR03437 family)